MTGLTGESAGSVDAYTLPFPNPSEVRDLMMRRMLAVAALLLVTAAVPAKAAAPAPVPAPAPAPARAAVPICLQQADGQTADQPPAPVVVCKQLFPTAPFVRLPEDQRATDGSATLYGVIELDINNDFHIQNARFYDRELKVYSLLGAAGKPMDETSPLMKQNHLPSNRVHFLVYEATGKLTSATAFQLTALRPAVLVDGQALDGRFVGAWEGLVSKRRTATQWFTDLSKPANFAKIRVEFAPPLVQTNNIGELKPTPALPDGKRFKVLGRFANATEPVRLSTGECAPALTSYGASNPLPDRIDVADYLIRIWRFPAMHSLWSKDFHVVFDYPRGLYSSATAMASEHNFRLKDFIAISTQAQPLVFRLHGNPIDQIVFQLKPVRGGGGACH